MDFYLTMIEGETKEQAEKRFYSLMEGLDKVENQESSYSVYEVEEREF